MFLACGDIFLIEMLVLVITAISGTLLMTWLDAMQANDCERIPDGSSALPFTQKYLNWHMRCRLIRPGMYGMKTAYECWIDFKVAQVKKIQMGIAIRCSPALGNEIRRVALTGDMGF